MADGGTTRASNQTKLVVVGQGYVGLPLAMRAVDVGYDVVGFDTDKARVKRLATGSSYVEDIADAELSHALRTGRYLPSSELSDTDDFDVAVITVPTPLTEGVPDLSYIEQSGQLLASKLKPGATVVLESTTYPGTTQELLQPLLEAESGLRAGPDFHLGYSPERIDPGNPTWNLQNTPKVVSGIDEASLGAVAAFYGSLVDTVVPVPDTKIAEMTKLLENTFRHVNIALVNELAMFASDLGIDVWAAIDAAATKPFGYMRFTPGPGVGGHCLPIDPSYLSWQVRRALGHSFRFVELANDVNNHMPDYVVRRVSAALNNRGKALKNSRILILGLAYKRNTSDARESPATRICELLVLSGAQVRATDPHVAVAHIPSQVARVELTKDEVELADAIVVVTDHDNVDYTLLENAPGVILDTRRRLTTPNAEHL